MRQFKPSCAFPWKKNGLKNKKNIFVLHRHKTLENLGTDMQNEVFNVKRTVHEAQDKTTDIATRQFQPENVSMISDPR